MRRVSIKIIIFVIAIFILSVDNVKSQSVAVTDNDAYTPDPTAMLDVMSTDKGMLVPRMTTEERLAIGLPGTPAIGLLVYDTNFNNFFYYNGITWMSLPQLDISGTSGPLFHVVNSYGDTIFAVYDDGVEIIVPTGVKGKVGGFAVSGRSPSKAEPDKYMLITPDSSRIYFDEPTTKGKVGGFAVSGRSPSKAVSQDYMLITPDSSRFYINDTVVAKGKVGGFAVSGRSPSKGTSTDIIVATVDSTRIYVDESAVKGKVGGFAVSGRSPSKGTTNSFLNLSSQNYFIGHNSGLNNTTGKFNFFAGYNSGYANVTGARNIFIGYESGYTNKGDEGPDNGSHNIFIGFQAGFNNLLGFNNIFLGNKSGYNNYGDETGDNPEDGSFNTFIGYESGYENQIGGSNTFLGYQAGYMNYEGNHNTYLGRWAGAANNKGSYNVFIGTEAGRREMGSNKLCINAVNDFNYRVPLIYGDFSDTKRYVVIDGDSTYNPGLHKLVVTGNVNAEDFIVGVEMGKMGKSNVKIESSLEKILALEGIKYDYTNTKGAINQTIGIDPGVSIKIIPEIVEDYGGMYGIKYSKLTVLLIEAIKEQQQQIDDLKNTILQKDIQLEKTSEVDEQIKLLMDENNKLKSDIEDIKNLLQSKVQ